MSRMFGGRRPGVSWHPARREGRSRPLEGGWHKKGVCPTKRLVTESGEDLRMKRTTRALFMVLIALTAATTLLTATLPALAASPGESTVFYPQGNGVTYSCTGGPPFIHSGHDASTGNCTVRHVGPPSGGSASCDVPTTITLVHDMHQNVEEGRLCG